MSSSISVLARSCLIVGIASGVMFGRGALVRELLGQESPAKGAKAGAPRMKEAEVKALVEQLGGAKEGERQAAMKKLQAAGVAAIPALGNAAAKGNKHATDNALDILTAHVEGADPEARQAAFVELRRLSVGSRPAVASVAKKVVKDHPDLKAESDAARQAARENRAERAEKSPAKSKDSPQPTPSAPADSATALRRQAIEQQIKDGETAIEKIKKLKLSKEMENQQIAAIMQGLQKLRADLKELDKGGRKK